MSSHAGVRSLSRARLFGSTARVLDLPRLVERYHQQPGNTAAARPFENLLLNRAIIIKHSLRPHERAIFDNQKFVATKLVFPITLSDLNSGAFSLFINEPQFVERMLKFLGLPSKDESFSRDERLLNIFDEVPAFDPFLIAERAALDDVDLPYGLIDLSDHDLIEMRQAISKSLSKIAALAIDENINMAADRLATAFLNNRNDGQLKPLQSAMRMTEGDFRKAIFSWKGILYYQWKLNDINSSFLPIVQSLKNIRPFDGDFETNRVIRNQSRLIVSSLNKAMVTVGEQLGYYDAAITAIHDNRDVEVFSAFLSNADETFRKIGMSASILSHCVDYWKFAFKDIKSRHIPTERALDIVNGLAAPLSDSDL